MTLPILLLQTLPLKIMTLQIMTLPILTLHIWHCEFWHCESWRWHCEVWHCKFWHCKFLYFIVWHCKFWSWELQHRKFWHRKFWRCKFSHCKLRKLAISYTAKSDPKLTWRQGSAAANHLRAPTLPKAVISLHHVSSSLSSRLLWRCNGLKCVIDCALARKPGESASKKYAIAKACQEIVQ